LAEFTPSGMIPIKKFAITNFKMIKIPDHQPSVKLRDGEGGMSLISKSSK
jgi:hypothetical protein